MAVPVSRQQFKEYCLRRLGYPVIDINVSDEQVEDRIDEALLFYQDYHFDGTERILEKFVVTEQDRTNGYLTIDQDIIGINNILPVGTALMTSNIFNIRYQMHLNDLWDLSSSRISYYTMAMSHVSLLEELFVGMKPLRYNRHVNKLHIDMDWQQSIQVGQYIIVDCYRIVDPDVYTDIWADRWLMRYTVALVKRQWGSNLSKFEGIQMPGGVTFNGSKIYQEADEELNKLEDTMISGFSLPVNDFVG
jgi:hypothetical protein